jgi:predicted GNAT superfamily acetyltransferase
MSGSKPKSALVIRDLNSMEDLAKTQVLEKQIWELSDLDVMPMTLAIAMREAGSLWLGAFDGSQLVGFAFAFLGMEHGEMTLHSHVLGVRPEYRDSDLGYKLKLAQRERALAWRVQHMTWTFDPLQSRNAHLNLNKLGVVSDSYKIDFYGPETSSSLHQNGTDRLWVKWPMASRRVQARLQGNSNRQEMLEALATVLPLVQFNGDGRPKRTDLAAALSRQRIAIEIPGDIGALQAKDPELARQWRQATRWAFSEGLQAGFFVAEFCRTIRGRQGPGAYLLQKGVLGEYVPELSRETTGRESGAVR